jgi:hypothetical protein
MRFINFVPKLKKCPIRSKPNKIGISRIKQCPDTSFVMPVAVIVMPDAVVVMPDTSFVMPVVVIVMPVTNFVMPIAVIVIPVTPFGIRDKSFVMLKERFWFLKKEGDFL